MDRLLSPAEVANLLGVRLGTVYQWTHTGFIPYVKLGKLVKFREQDVVAWVEKRSRKGRTGRRIDLNLSG